MPCTTNRRTRARYALARAEDSRAFWMGAGAFTAWWYHRNPRSPLFWFAAGFGAAAYWVPWVHSARVLHTEIHTFFERLHKMLKDAEEKEHEKKEGGAPESEVCAFFLYAICLLKLFVRLRQLKRLQCL